MTSYIVCLKSVDADAYEIAFCESDFEARAWADQILAYAPGFELAGILRQGVAVEVSAQA